ncbi:DUF317 domain-containing protein [Kitasatospora sp. NPDC057015]|uniref:DUF317 domain-containing protein n=1 Tax=Kitasatospora sp. NPDC057015 TaxID=3346001 RepID=UPI00363C6818
MLVSPCQRVRVEEDLGATWEPALTVAAYSGPTGDALWRARFSGDAPDEVLQSFMCALACDLAEPDPRDQQRALRGPAAENASDCLPDLSWCPAAGSGTFCGCRRTFGLDHTYRAERGWVLWGIADGGRWRVTFDDVTPAHLITAACRPLAASVVCGLTGTARLTGSPDDPDGSDGFGDLVEAGTAPAGEPAEPSARSRRSRAKGAPLETVLQIARESLQGGGGLSATTVAKAVRERGVGIGTTRAEQVAAILKAERAAAAGQ